VKNYLQFFPYIIIIFKIFDNSLTIKLNLTIQMMFFEFYAILL